YSAAWTDLSGSGGSPTVCGVAVTTPVTGNLDGTGSLGITLYDNLQIFPSPSQWTFTIKSVGNIGSFTSASTVTGNSTNLSSALQTAAIGFTEHVWYDATNNVFYPPISAGTGSV